MLKLFQGFLWLLFVCWSIEGYCLPGDLQRVYKSPMGEEKWKASGNRLRCGLSLGIPDYGVAYFEQYATKEPHFIIHKYQQVERAIPSKLIAKSPVWKPGRSSWFISKTLLKPGKYGFFLERMATLRMLNYLANGLITQFSYRSEQGFEVFVRISPIHFQKEYEDYIRCVGHLLSFNYDDVKDSFFYFSTDDVELSAKDKQQLKRIALYSREDRRLREIRITGYTDDTGRRSYNNAISELRAKAVAQYLKRKGVRHSILSVTWVGEKDPVQSNDTEEGRAANRRVQVKLLY